MSERPSAPPGPTARWDRLIAEMEATAADYRAAGYETVTVEPVDISVVPASTVGLVAAVDRETYERAAAFYETHDLDRGDRQVSITVGEDVVTVAVAVESPAETDAGVLLVPLYYRRTPEDEGSLRDCETLPVRLRDRSSSDAITVTFDDPAAFLPADPLDD